MTIKASSGKLKESVDEMLSVFQGSLGHVWNYGSLSLSLNGN